MRMYYQRKRETLTQHAREARAVRRLNGLCGKCGEAPLPGQTQCQECRERQAKYRPSVQCLSPEDLSMWYTQQVQAEVARARQENAPWLVAYEEPLIVLDCHRGDYADIDLASFADTRTPLDILLEREEAGDFIFSRAS